MIEEEEAQDGELHRIDALIVGQQQQQKDRKSPCGQLQHFRESPPKQ